MNPTHPPFTPPSPLPPNDVARVKIGPKSDAAAGLKALQKTAAHALREMGPVRASKLWLKINQVDGFDCQSCAWPNPDTERHVFEFCENGVKAMASEATSAHADKHFFRQYSVGELSEKSDYWLERQGRITHPLVLRSGSSHYTPISWEEAFDTIGSHLKELDSPDEASFYTSGRTSNEAAFLYQLFVRAFGTNNLPDCSNLCHESSGAALGPTIGIGKGCVSLDDFEKADLIMVVGQNPGTNHPRMLACLQQAHRRGCKIITINPLAEVGSFRFKNPQELKNPLTAPAVIFGRGTPLTDLWLPVRINGDMAVFQGLLKELLEEEDLRPGEVFDLNFIRDHTAGFDELIARLRATSWEEIVSSSGLSRAHLKAATDLILRSERIIVCWAMGLTQQPNAVATIQEIVNFLLARGNIGKPGAGPCPVRGHSNVQGDRTMGIWERPPAAFLDRLDAQFAFKSPRKHGLDVVGTIKGLYSGSVKVLVALGGNFLSASPDTEYTAAALRRARLTVHVSTKLNRSHLITGHTALILPCLGRTEIDQQETGPQFVTVEDSMGIISSSRGSLKPATAHLLSEPAIIAGIARATLGPLHPIDWAYHLGNYDRIRNLVEKVIPGFDHFNTRIQLGPFYLPNAPRDRREFATKSGKALFTVHTLPVENLAPGQWIMMTLRSHDQFNTTIYGLDDRYRGIYNGRRVVFLNPHDMQEHGLVQGQIVDLTSHFRGEMRIASYFMVAPYDIPRRCAATYFPETNVLVPIDSTAEISQTPTSKNIIITIAPSLNPDAALAAFSRR